MLLAALAFVALAACFMGPAMTAAMERFTTDVRFSGFAFGYNIGAGVFGGTTPLVATWLIQTTGCVFDLGKPLVCPPNKFSVIGRR